MSETIKNKIQLKRGPNSPGTILSEGEPGYDLVNHRLYIGNGVGKSPTRIPNEDYVTAEIAKAQLSGTADLSSYATKEFVNNAIKDVDVDLEGYATEDYVNQAIEGVSVEDVAYYDDENTADSMIPINVDTLGGRPYSEYATENFVKDSIAEAMLDGEVDLSNYVTKEDLAAIDFPVDSVNGKTGSIELNAVDVGAAPSGYGLGESAVSTNDLNDAINCGWWVIQNNTLNRPFDYGMGMTIKRYSNRFVQIAFNPHMGSSCGEICVRSNNGTEWLPWEYVNPPMKTGVEYRTTERWNGKPVYTKIVDYGSLPASGSKDVIHTANGIIENVVSWCGTYADIQALPNPALDVLITTTTIRISVKSDLSAFSTQIAIKYTKL